SILWKHGKNKVAEWDKDFGGLDIYAAFINRTTLNQTTGELRITGLTKTDSGVYSVEFNSKLLDKTYTRFVIKAVPKPTITSSCNPDKTSCILTCEGDTTDAQPITYSWNVGEGAWAALDKQLNVFKSDTGKSTNSYKYICKINNTVSEEVSEPVGEVFVFERSYIGAVVALVILTIVVIVLIGMVWKKQTGDAVNNQNSVSPDTVYHTVEDVQVANSGASGVLSGVAMDTVYSTVGNASDVNNQTAKGSDGVQPEQGVTLTVNRKTGEDDADKAGNGQENGGDAVNNQNSVAPDTVYHTVDDVQVANHGASMVLSGFAMDAVYSLVGEKTSRDFSMNPNNNNKLVIKFDLTFI
uniref:Ig-like domain-containing protein n=1 Tax=Hucho hucho TaxID=62062 RepID=A0A4W5JP00_9TELE